MKLIQATTAGLAYNHRVHTFLSAEGGMSPQTLDWLVPPARTAPVGWVRSLWSRLFYRKEQRRPRAEENQVPVSNKDRVTTSLHRRISEGLRHFEVEALDEEFLWNGLVSDLDGSGVSVSLQSAGKDYRRISVIMSPQDFPVEERKWLRTGAKVRIGYVVLFGELRFPVTTVLPPGKWSAEEIRSAQQEAKEMIGHWNRHDVATSD